MHSMKPDANWVDLSRDAESGIETIRAHFRGHAYDAHWHDSYLVGVTEQGVQQFRCRRVHHHSTPGKVFLLEPGEVHDGDAPTEEGFTYRMLYLPQDWVEESLETLRQGAGLTRAARFESTLTSDAHLAKAVFDAFRQLRQGGFRLARHAALDAMLGRLARHLGQPEGNVRDRSGSAVATAARDYLHDHMHDDIGLDDLSRATGSDRFSLTRAFKRAFGLPPHAYLVQLRLTHARRLLSQGLPPSVAAADMGFSDQSHLGRWFKRSYGLTPASYRRMCTNIPDESPVTGQCRSPAGA